MYLPALPVCKKEVVLLQDYVLKVKMGVCQLRRENEWISPLQKTEPVDICHQLIGTW